MFWNIEMSGYWADWREVRIFHTAADNHSRRRGEQNRTKTKALVDWAFLKRRSVFEIFIVERSWWVFLSTSENFTGRSEGSIPYLYNLKNRGFQHYLFFFEICRMRQLTHKNCCYCARGTYHRPPRLLKTSVETTCGTFDLAFLHCSQTPWLRTRRTLPALFA